MIKGGQGGANTNKNGLLFESKVDVRDAFHNYGIDYEEVLEYGKGIYKLDLKDQNVFVMQKQTLYRYLESQIENYDSRNFVSKELWPDNCVINVTKKRISIIEVKFQEGAGSVDEKIQTCDFKRKQYVKIAKPLGYHVEYIYVLSDWFKNPRYKDSLDYIIDSGCKFYFGSIPIEEII